MPSSVFRHSPTLAEENESSMVQDDATVGGVVPMFDAEQTIGATLASIRRQTYQVLDIVVVDDGSTDGSASIVTDQRILFYLRTRRG